MDAANITAGTHDHKDNLPHSHQVGHWELDTTVIGFCIYPTDSTKQPRNQVRIQNTYLIMLNILHGSSKSHEFGSK